MTSTEKKCSPIVIIKEIPIETVGFYFSHILLENIIKFDEPQNGQKFALLTEV